MSLGRDTWMVCACLCARVLKERVLVVARLLSSCSLLLSSPVLPEPAGLCSRGCWWPAGG